jgi:hypothetical protein
VQRSVNGPATPSQHYKADFCFKNIHRTPQPMDLNDQLHTGYMHCTFNIQLQAPRIKMMLEAFLLHKRPTSCVLHPASPLAPSSSSSSSSILPPSFPLAPPQPPPLSPFPPACCSSSPPLICGAAPPSPTPPTTRAPTCSCAVFRSSCSPPIAAAAISFSRGSGAVLNFSYGRQSLFDVVVILLNRVDVRNYTWFESG